MTDKKTNPGVHTDKSDCIYDVVVIGAGIIGTCIAEKLQHQGHSVLLVDKQGVAEGCSKGNAGHFATDIILPLANFSTLLKAPKYLLDPLGPLTIDLAYLPKLIPWLIRFAWSAMPHKTRQTIHVLKQLNRTSIDLYRALLERTNLSEFLTQKGALTLYQTAQAEKQNIANANWLSRHNINVEVLTPTQIQELEPALKTGFRGGLFFPDTANCINPYRLVTGLFEFFQQNGGKFRKLEILAIEQAKNKSPAREINLVTNNGPIQTHKVVIACGAWSHQLAVKLGHKVPLETERGYHYMLPKAGVTINRPITSFERAFVMTPMENGLRLAGTVELAGLNKPSNQVRAEQLYNNACDLFPNLDNRLATTWMGHRPSLPDSLPVISHSKHNKDIIFAFGHQHLGLTQGAITADLVSQLLADEMDQPLQAQLSINRF